MGTQGTTQRKNVSVRSTIIMKPILRFNNFASPVQFSAFAALVLQIWNAVAAKKATI